MSEARLPTGQKWVMTLDPTTGGWMPVVALSGDAIEVDVGDISVDIGYVQISGTVAVAEPLTVEGAVSILDSWIHVTGSVNVAEPVTVDGFVAVTGSVSILGTVPVSGTVSVNEPVTVDGFVSITGSVSESWRVALTQDEDANDSDKTFTVPASQEWQLLWIWVEYASFTGTAANPTRQLELQMLDSGDDVIGTLHPGKTQTNGQSYNYMFAPGLPDLTSFRDTSYLLTPIPTTLFLAAGQKLRVWDNNAADAGNDDMNVQIQYAWRSV